MTREKKRGGKDRRRGARIREFINVWRWEKEGEAEGEG